MTSAVPPQPEPAPGDPDTPGSTSASVTTAVPPQCPTRTRRYRGGRLVEEGFPAEKLSDVLSSDPDSVVWLDLQDPDEQDLQIVVDEFGLHPLAVEDAVHDHQRPKIDRYRTHLFANVYAVEVQKDPVQVATAEISMFITPRALITIRKSEFNIDSLIAQWDADTTLADKATVSFLLHGLLDAIVDGQYLAIEILEAMAEDLEDDLFVQRQSGEVRRQAFRLRRALADLRRVVVPMHDVVGRLRIDPHLATEALAPYYQDVYDHVLRTAESIEGGRDLVASILDANQTEQSNQLNETTKKLAAWAAIIAVPTAVTGFYGQNIPYPGYGTHTGFLMSAIVIIALAGGVYALLRSRGWL
jgi:magnesium transporter